MVSRSPLDNSSLSLPALHRVLLLLPGTRIDVLVHPDAQRRIIETLSMSRALPSVVAHLTDLTSLPALFDRLCNPAVKLVLEAPYLMVTIRWRNPPLPLPASLL